MTNLNNIVNTISSRIKTDVEVTIKLSTQLADVCVYEIKTPALKSILLQVQNQATELVRRSVYTEIRRQLQDIDNIEALAKKEGFSMEEVEKELELLRYLMEPVDLQPEEVHLSDQTEMHLKLTDEGFIDAAPIMSIEELPLVKFKPGTSGVVSLSEGCGTLTYGEVNEGF